MMHKRTTLLSRPHLLPVRAVQVALMTAHLQQTFTHLGRWKVQLSLFVYGLTDVLASFKPVREIFKFILEIKKKRS